MAVLTVPVMEETGEKNDEPVVCFVCTGNTCRSPMAEAVLKSRGYKSAFSRGISAYEGTPISAMSVIALSEAGIGATAENDYPSHRARNMREEDMARTDLVYCMTAAHASSLFFSYPQYAGKIHVMMPEVSDPFGGSIEAYRKALAEITSALAEIFPAL